MKRLAAVTLAVGLLAVAVGVASPALTEAAAPSPFAGEWRAVSPLALPDAHLSITGGHVLFLRLRDPFDVLFCGSTATDIRSVRAAGVGFMTGERTLTAVFVFRCSDGATGYETVEFRFPPLSPTTDEMADSSGHVWTRVP